MNFLKFFCFAAFARAIEIDEEGVEESGITIEDIYTVIVDNDSIQTFIENNDLTFNVAEGECDEVS